VAHSAPASSAGDGYPPAPAASTETSGGWFPVKNEVSTTTPWMIPGAPGRITAVPCFLPGDSANRRARAAGHGAGGPGAKDGGRRLHGGDRGR